MHAPFAQSSPTLCDSMDRSPSRLLCPWGLSMKEYWNALACPPPGTFPRIKPEPPALAGGSFIS